MNSSASPGSEFITGCEGWIVDSKCTEARAVTVISIIVNIITAPITSLMNGLVIIAVKRKPQLKTISNIALACLATTDCFMGVIGQPTFIALNIVILQVDGSNTYCFIRKLSNAVLKNGIRQGVAVTPNSNVPRQVYCHKAPVPVHKCGYTNSHSLIFHFCVDCGTTLDCNLIHF